MARIKIFNVCLLLFFTVVCPITIQSKVLTVDLRDYEKRLISQNGEDGIIQKIFDLIGTTNKYYVEFGAGKGHCCSNTKYLREKYGWSGLLLEGYYPDDSSINLHKEFITAENICALFAKYNVPYDFDLISIDIDRNDFYVWHVLSRTYKPRVVIIECNPFFEPNDDKVIKYSAHAKWNGTAYSGASVRALFNLGRRLGYSLVYQESSGVNLFFIRDDVLETIPDIEFKNMNNVMSLYVQGKQKINKNNPNFISSAQALR